MKFEIALVSLLSLSSVAIAGCSIIMCPDPDKRVVMVDRTNEQNVTKFVPERVGAQCNQPE